MSDPIPTNLQEIDQEFIEEIEKHENGRLFQLLYAGVRMNRDRLEELIKWIKWMVPTVVSLVGVFAAYLAL